MPWSAAKVHVFALAIVTVACWTVSPPAKSCDDDCAERVSRDVRMKRFIVDLKCPAENDQQFVMTDRNGFYLANRYRVQYRDQKADFVSQEIQNGLQGTWRVFFAGQLATIDHNTRMLAEFLPQLAKDIEGEFCGRPQYERIQIIKSNETEIARRAKMCGSKYYCSED